MIRIIDLDKVVSNKDSSIRDVLSKINLSGFQFQIILDTSNHIVGTVTDGDIRRAILRGVTLDGPASKCMQINPTLGKLNDDDDNLIKLKLIKGHVIFLPVIDNDNIVKEVLVSESRTKNSTIALIMAGGYGSRLGEHTKNKPKPLLSVGDKPILEHILERLEMCGYKDIFLSVHYKAEKIQEYIKKRINKSEIHFLYEKEPMGTAGALRNIPDEYEGAILVLNGDVITNANFTALENFHQKHNYDATVCTTRYDVEVPFGVVRYNSDCIFESIDEKPRVSYMVAAGVYLLSSEFRNLVPVKKKFDMPELLNLGREINLKIGVFPFHEYWIDIGYPKDLKTANEDHDLKNS